MFIWCNGRTERVILRDVQGFRKLRINEDVNNCDNVDLGVDEDSREIVVFRSEKSESEYLLVKKYGLLYGETSIIELFICADNMLINLIDGFIVVENSEGEDMLVSVGKANFTGDNVKIDWKTTKDMISLLSVWQDIYPMDFAYTLQVGTKAHKSGICFLSKLIEKQDLSLGAVSTKQIRDEKSQGEKLFSTNESAEYDLNIDEAVNDIEYLSKVESMGYGSIYSAENV